MSSILNVAHRGFTQSFPDNSLEAFEDAIHIGVDAIECDVRETSDGNFVIIHDEMLMGKPVSEYQLSEIIDIRCSSGSRIATLPEVLDLCRNRVKLLLDVKELKSLDRFLKVTISTFDRSELIVASFNHLFIHKIARAKAGIRTGLIREYPEADLLSLLKNVEAIFIVAAYSMVEGQLVEKVHRAGYKILVWDLLDEKSIRRAVSLGVDGIVSDYPHATARIIGKASSRR